MARIVEDKDFDPDFYSWKGQKPPAPKTATPPGDWYKQYGQA